MTSIEETDGEVKTREEWLTDSEVIRIGRVALFGAYEGKETLLVHGAIFPLCELIPDPTQQPDNAIVRAAIERHLRRIEAICKEGSE